MLGFKLADENVHASVAPARRRRFVIGDSVFSCKYLCGYHAVQAPSSIALRFCPVGHTAHCRARVLHRFEVMS